MSVPKVVGCRPVGSTVMVQHLTDQEMLGTNLTLAGGKNRNVAEVQQSYIVAVGPQFDPEKWGFNVGDRVLVIGSYNPVPNFPRDNDQREMGIVEPHNVRGVLTEATVEEETQEE